MKLIALILFAVLAGSVAFAQDSNPADNASEIVPPHRATGYTYAKDDPLYRIIHGTNERRVRENELSANEYNPCPECQTCVNCDYTTVEKCENCEYEGDVREERPERVEHRRDYRTSDERIYRDYR